MDGTEIKIARIKAGLKQTEIAQLLGIPQPRLSEFENGRRTPSPDILDKLLNIFRERGALPQGGEALVSPVLPSNPQYPSKGA